MKQWNYLPPALLRKILLTILSGVAFLGAGIIFAYLTKDYDLILLSLLIFGFCLFRTFVLWRMCWKGTYATVSGICDEITPHPMEQYMKVQVVLPDNTVREIILDRKTKILPGREYSFYFRSSEKYDTGSDYLDATLSGYNFLGFDDLTPNA